MKNLLILNTGFLTNETIGLIIFCVTGIVVFVIWGQNAMKPLKKKYDEKIKEEEGNRFRRLFKKFKSQEYEKFREN